MIEAPVEVTALVMAVAPEGMPPAPPWPELRLTALTAVDAALYHQMYHAVGEPWRWQERMPMTMPELADVLADPAILVQVCWVGEAPVGFFELDARCPGLVRIAYLGLLPDWIGRGLGHWLIATAVAAAWRQQPRRVWLHTSNWDHPRALACYLAAGFTPLAVRASGGEDRPAKANGPGSGPKRPASVRTLDC